MESLIEMSDEHEKNEENKEFLFICICDEGVGIPPDELTSIFDKFVQSSKTKTGAGGTGLGLSICHEIIAAHNGKIWANNNDNGGASFTFTLPLNQQTALSQ